MIDMIAAFICLFVSLAAAIVAGACAATADEKNSLAGRICVWVSTLLGVVALMLAHSAHL